MSLPLNAGIAKATIVALAVGSGSWGVSNPGRMVTRLGNVLDRMGATTFPPKAGFNWTNRPSSSIAKSMASPVRPNDSRAAIRDAKSLPSAVEAKSTA